MKRLILFGVGGGGGYPNIIQYAISFYTTSGYKCLIQFNVRLNNDSLVACAYLAIFKSNSDHHMLKWVPYV